ncbi:hypothetical protein Tco_0775137 [Tanacetum coccineum]|uniref:Uncharacterized protein n=1 Tax=Tanacetum coccineum TaxID=301880 RepID=A0ABQ4YIW9_9ASTR
MIRQFLDLHRNLRTNEKCFDPQSWGTFDNQELGLFLNLMILWTSILPNLVSDIPSFPQLSASRMNDTIFDPGIEKNTFLRAGGISNSSVLSIALLRKTKFRDLSRACGLRHLTKPFLANHLVFDDLRLDTILEVDGLLYGIKRVLEAIVVH